uniref:Holin n=1 Tax=viral metagenome TaxID=1070528 RepID=A0A6H1ZEZ4_9ZZZZ
MKDLAYWLKGLFMATANGALLGVGGSVIAPEQINTKDGKAALAGVATFGAIQGAYLYLKNPPAKEYKGKNRRR